MACLSQKFVVFGSLMDLKAHMVEVHGANMSTRDMKDIRRIEVEFDSRQASSGNRPERSRGRGHDPGRDIEREPPPHVQPARLLDRRREVFGSALTEGADQEQTSGLPTSIRDNITEFGSLEGGDVDAETLQ